MAQFFDYTGVVEEVLPVQTFSSGFTKRDVIVGNDVDSPSKYPNPVKFTFKKDNCSLLDGIQKGQRVQVHFVVDGRRWDGPKGTQYFVDLTALKITAPDLKKLGAIDEIVKEPAGGAQKNHKAACAVVKAAVLKALAELKKLDSDELLEKRYDKLRKLGNFY